MRIDPANPPHIRPLERGFSLVAGLCLLRRGFRRGGIDGLVSVVAGSFLTARSMDGTGELRRLIEVRRRRDFSGGAEDRR
ncbi:hypothetical protein [Parvibaculum sp.]|uniref:hypothetical protein n=1 Tax=Parvibaculum sp. TaxID=2024848 RepID=UPI002D09CCDE|nr:hypothetical protein [Parvibaculum sp.]HUD53320.1 hypothetical protein [Parvibaculum sp.]